MRLQINLTLKTLMKMIQKNFQNLPPNTNPKKPKKLQRKDTRMNLPLTPKSQKSRVSLKSNTK